MKVGNDRHVIGKEGHTVDNDRHSQNQSWQGQTAKIRVGNKRHEL